MALAGVEPEQTVLIGDRAERDGMAARRAGAHALIRSDKPLPGWITFRRFDDPVFAPMLAS
jgi:putative hydrolase of the HAD superfamily